MTSSRVVGLESGQVANAEKRINIITSDMEDNSLDQRWEIRYC